MLPGLSLAPLTLAVVLLLSGAAKLRDPGSTAGMIEALRLPRPLRHRSVPLLLPVAELVTAVLLLAPWAEAYAVGAALAAGLFTAFLAVIARAMTLSPRPVCACFGRVGDHRVTGRTLGRNLLLVALAVVAVWPALNGTSAVALVRGYGASDWVWLLMAAALAAVSVLVLGTAGTDEPVSQDERGGRDERRGPVRDQPVAHAGGTPHADRGRGERERSPAPRGVLLSQDLEVVPLHRLARQRPQLLVFVNCWCGSTFEAVERLPFWRDRLTGIGVHLVHTYRPWDEVRLDGLDGVWWDPGATVFDALGASSPTAVLLGTDGLADAPVSGVESIEDLVARLAGRATPGARVSR